MTYVYFLVINPFLASSKSFLKKSSHTKLSNAEMLAQMDRTGGKGIFIIGATNYPNMIDPAMLRSGRLEKKFYLPLPDSKLRKALFKMSLNKSSKVLDLGINFDTLATLTENYVSADIEKIVNDAALIAMSDNSRITMDLLKKVIKSFRPFPKEELEKYESIKAGMEGENSVQKNDRTQIGYNSNR